MPNPSSLNLQTLVRAEGAAPEVVVDEEEEGTRVENASRLEWDRSRARRPSGLVDPEKADAEFMVCLLELLRKVRPRH